jgi:predicted NBD/HSP70 family sugar kinase
MGNATGKRDACRSRATGNQAQKLTRTRNAVLALVRKYPGLSRQDCARRLELSAFTLSRVVGELVDEGLLREGPAAVAGAPSRQGRPATPLAVNPGAVCMAGIDLEASWWRFVVVDFAGQERFRMVQPFTDRASPAAYCNCLRALFERARKACGKLWRKVAGMGVAAPGLLDVDRGVIAAYQPLPGFEQVPIRDLYAEVSRRPTFVLHNVLSLAAADLWRRAGSETETTFHAVVRSGIAGVLTDRARVVRGSHGLAGELGHLRVNLGARRGRSLQEVAGLQALRRDLRQVSPALWTGGPEAVADALETPGARRTLSRAMGCLGRALAGVAALTDPDRVVVHSPLFREPNALWPLVMAGFAEALCPELGRRVVLERSELAETAAASGAALFALNCLHPAAADPLSLPGAMGAE